MLFFQKQIKTVMQIKIGYAIIFGITYFPTATTYWHILHFILKAHGQVTLKYFL